MEDLDTLYSVPKPYCQCGIHTGQYFKKFVKRLKKGEKGVEILRDMGLRKMCCLSTFLSLTTLCMIDETIVYTDETKNIFKKEEDILPEFSPQVIF